MLFVLLLLLLQHNVINLTETAINFFLYPSLSLSLSISVYVCVSFSVEFEAIVAFGRQANKCLDMEIL